MTHNWHDEEALAVLAHFDLPYVGIIGNATRAEQILATLATHNGSRRGIEASFYYPAGLDIGAQTPEEIALSRVAEIQPSCLLVRAHRSSTRRVQVQD